MSDTCLESLPVAALPRPRDAGLSRISCAIELAGPSPSQPIEISIDGQPYRSARWVDGAWRFECRTGLDGGHHMVAVIRAALEVP